LLRSETAEDLVGKFFWSDLVTAFASGTLYDEFKQRVQARFDGIEHVSIVGSGNWGHSLNPDKFLEPFSQKSDIDVAAVSFEQFSVAWEELRKFHRNRWYELSPRVRDDLRRNGQNVYAGFVSPKWIPDKRSSYLFQHRVALDKLSDSMVGYRSVNMYFFKNSVEALDYYLRGFKTAQRRIGDAI
jgi:hypothetical protein